MLGYKADDYVMVIIVEDNKDCCKGFCFLWLLDCCSLLAWDTLASLLFLSQSRHASHLGPLFWLFPGICSDNCSSSLKALLKFYLFHEAFLFFCYLWVLFNCFLKFFPQDSSLQNLHNMFIVCLLPLERKLRKNRDLRFSQMHLKHIEQ